MNIKVQTCCKINLGLNVIEKRPDGYHNLQTIFYPIPLNDEISIQSSQADEIGLAGHPLEGNKNDNLVMKAIRMLRAENFDIPPVRISLRKKIPSGAGLGGGSSDAACIVKSLNEVLKLGIKTSRMEQMVSKLGADCPFFIQAQPVYAEGIGNIFTPIQLDLTEWYLVLVKPDDHISTKEAYALIKPHKPKITIPEIIKMDINSWKELLTNDFEDSVFPNHPTIKHIKEKLYQIGATYACMSGSGSSVYGLFKEEPQIPETFNSHFVFTCKL